MIRRPRLSARLMTAAAVSALCSAPAFAETSAAATSAEPDVITVTSTPLRLRSDEVVGSVTVLSEERLVELLDGNIADTLDALPGVSSSYFGPASGRPVIRGLSEDRVAVLINGLTAMDASSASPDHAVAGEALGASGVEVLRGPAAIAYGGNAIGGVVNILDGRVPTQRVDGLVDGFAYLGATSVDEGTQAAGRVAFGAGPFVFQLEALRREAENFDIPGFAESAAYRAAEEDEHDHDDEHDEDHDDDHDHDHEEDEEDFGTVSNSFYTFETVSGAVSLVEDWGFVGFAVKSTDGEYGLPGHSHAHEHGEEDHDHDDDHDDDHDHEEEEGGALVVMEQTRIDLRGELNFDGFFNRVRWSLAYGDYEHSELEGDGEVGVTFTRDGVEGRIEFAHDHEGARQGAWGLQFLDQEFAASGEEAFVPPVNTADLGLFAVERWEFQSWGVEAGARLETRDLTGQNASRDFTTVSASGSVFFRPVEQSFLAVTVSRTERAPTDTELFSNGPHLATETFEVGDLDLGVETALSIEGTARWSGGRWSGEASVFHSEYDGFIGLFATGAEEDELDVFEYRQADASLTGFEAAGRLDLGEALGAAWSTDASVEYVQGEVDGGGDLPRIPPLSGLLGVEADFGSISVRGETRLVAEQDNVAQFELPTEGYTLLNASVEWRPFDGSRDVALIAGVRNITDEEARAHTSFLKDLVPLPGRNVRLAVRAGF
jgi:iron complex outermembrane receptor protein